MADSVTHAVDADHEHDHPDYVQHHFHDAVQQRESAKFGMWIFLVTEILFFGGLFVTYAIFHRLHPETFHDAHKLLDWRLGMFNTFVLITSSLTFALSIRYIQVDRIKIAIYNLVATFLLAGTFMVVKYFEYAHKFHEGQLPGKFYTYTGLTDVVNPHTFFSIYFAMTGLHGLHVLIGMGVIVWLIVRARRGDFHSKFYNAVEVSGLYWHLVDLIWIFLFPLLYLIG
jgi:cytochrome c oxidase subunit III